MKFTYRANDSYYQFSASSSNESEVVQFVSETNEFFSAVNEAEAESCRAIGAVGFTPALTVDYWLNDFLRWNEATQSLVSLRPFPNHRVWKIRIMLDEANAIKFKLMYECVKEEDKQ